MDYRDKKKNKMNADIHAFCQKGIMKSMLKVSKQIKMAITDKTTCFKSCRYL